MQTREPGLLYTTSYQTERDFVSMHGTDTTAQEILERAGVSFTFKGAPAVFNGANGKLVVRNTPDQLELVQLFLQSLAESETSAGESPASTQGEKMPKASNPKLTSIILPKIEFRDTPFTDALQFLQARSVELDQDSDPADRGINFVLSGITEGEDPAITLQLTNVPLGDALRYSCKLAGFDYESEPHAIVIRPKK